jgi:hypothetical protein
MALQDNLVAGLVRDFEVERAWLSGQATRLRELKLPRRSERTGSPHPRDLSAEPQRVRAKAPSNGIRVAADGSERRCKWGCAGLQMAVGAETNAG